MEKIRPECLSCIHLFGKTPESADCLNGNLPTCYRKKKPCCDFLEKDKSPEILLDIMQEADRK